MTERTIRRKGLELGELEAEILRILKDSGDASAGDIAELMQSRRAIAYTTISTTLDRLFKKELVSRKAVAGRTGQKYVYSLINNPRIEKQLVDTAVSRLVEAFGPSVTSTIYDRLNEISSTELQEIRETIEKRRKRDEPS